MQIEDERLAQYRIPSVGDGVRVTSIPYSVIKVVHGGMASVVIMERMADAFGDPVMRPRLACKMFWSHSITDEQISNELNVWCSLKHPNIVPLLSLMPVSLRLSALMPVYSHTLGDLIRSKGPLTKDLTIKVLQHLGDALAAADRQCGCVHLDIKPANVLVDEGSGEARFHLSDWGIATLHELSYRGSIPHKSPLNSHAETYSKWGTLPYMAPERLLGSESASPAMDMFSLGILAFECLTGALPYSSCVPHDIAREILSGSYLRAIRNHPDIDAKTINFICNLVDPNASSRIQSCSDMRAALSPLHRGRFGWFN